ncbi:glycosyltransferase [Mucispirillum schaedleri]|jgi:glycosyltransferase involved in cell wall biosynthesis|uniref:Glycosyltransferase n=1 Tax=Mucispirillum schaedleri ASF457 TaxID=1379858 RepID=V2QAI7_9BACT|nr:glycosyltransferase [Mucispirillum schaedleri]MCX4360133.1 glycosyltransferase [Mucispirillum schaedleri]USF24696.1 putative glycosyltransferase [Mucispirillum schaedleri ASF457]SIW07849.1 bactoprenol glucosyl transferase; CPS-53 (KpLE1) prophage [Mucispirillum schaedleri ASF457]
MKNKLISALIPAYNEEECLHELYKRVTAVLSKLENYDYEILIINDGSKDKTLEILQELHDKDNHIQYVNLARNYGKEIAMAAGFDYVKGDVVVILDADLQDPPELIPDMISYYEAGYDDIYGRRKSRKGETWLKKTTAKLFYKLLQKSTRVDILKDTGDFRLLSRRAVEALKKYKEQRRYTKGFFALIGFKKKEFLYDRDSRVAGQSKWNYFNLFNLAIEGITSFSNFPLRLSSFLGIIVAAFGFIYIVFLVLKTLIFGEPVRGYPTLLSVIIFLGGIQLLSLGVIGEYLGRIFDEVKNRPLYFVEKYSGDEE